jgi:hypothetical protein
MRVIEASMASSLVARRSTEGLTAIQRIMDAASRPARRAAIWSLPVDFNHCAQDQEGGEREDDDRRRRREFEETSE